MKKQSIRSLSLVLAFVMVFLAIPYSTVIVYADGEAQNTQSGGTSVAQSLELVETDDFENINNANALANGVDAYFNDANRGQIIIENKNMQLAYNVSAHSDQYVAYLKNKQGESYFENTMDVFTKVNGTKVYASGSQLSSEFNIDRLGYYYYQVSLEGQNFASSFNVGQTQALNLNAFTNASKASASYSGSTLTVTINDPSDPYVYAQQWSSWQVSMGKKNMTTYSADTYNYLAITVKADVSSSADSLGMQVFYQVDGMTEFDSECSKGFTIINDNEVHTYYIPMEEASFKGTVKGLRFDFNGCSKGDKFYITKIEAVSNSSEDSASSLLLKRYFGTFSDKLNHRVQVAALNETTGIQSIGVETKIDKSTVNNIIVKDKNGFHSYLSEATATISATSDPYLWYNNLNVPADYKKVSITVKAPKVESNKSVTLYFATAENGLADERTKRFTFSSDGEYHTYTVDFSTITSLTGALTQLRIDFNGSAVGQQYSVKEIKFTNADGTKNKFIDPSSYYSTSQISTPVQTSTVLDEVDWNSAEYVGFEINDVGVFGYILLADGNNDSLTVTLENGYYCIVQERTPTGNSLSPSVVGMESPNGNDFYMNQRLYTDEESSFDKFITEAEIERNPLTSANFEVYEDESSIARGTDDFIEPFVGYDAWRGTYTLIMDGTGFGNAHYYMPNRHYNLKFKVVGDNYDRNIYIMAATNKTGSLESATVLDANNMMLPIPVEVCKNFAEANGEMDTFMLDDIPYSEAIFPLKVKQNEEKTYNVVHIYTNWGNYPVKQLSSVQFYAPYYHLSTGTTETNCIIPWYSGRGLSVLPDFRSMSAPYWTSGDPQHNSCGTHKWLIYTDDQGVYSASELVNNTILFSGPTYASVQMDYVSDDQKIDVSYVHTEMPQRDENRTYYEVTYTFKEDITFSDFKNQFQFYSVTDNDTVANYKKISYLNQNGVSEYISNDIAEDSPESRICVLGSDRPYFTMYEMEAPYSFVDGYANVGAIICDYDFSDDNKDSYQFALRYTYNKLQLTLNQSSVTFSAGETIKMNIILLPWGSQELNGTYDTYKDTNVLNVRNELVSGNLLNVAPYGSYNDCTAVESAFVPMVRSTNGESATFVLNGGNSTCAVRAFGFNKLTAPKVQELINGEWVDYELSSKNNPDQRNYAYAYDGYGVNKDSDGTYSYSFITDMTGGGSRTFRITAADDFEGWEEVPYVAPESPLNLYMDPEFISNHLTVYGESDIVLLDNNKVVRMYYDGSDARTDNEMYFSLKNGATLETGKYLVFKYRLPTTNQPTSTVYCWTDTVDGECTPGKDNFKVDLVQDGQWKIAVVDCTKYVPESFKDFKDIYYYAKFVRIDILSSTIKRPSTDYVDFAYVGFTDSLDDVIQLETDENTEITLYNNDSPKNIGVNSETGNLHFTPSMLYQSINSTAIPCTLKNDTEHKNMPYVSCTTASTAAELYVTLYNDETPLVNSGSYVGVLYRVDKKNNIEFFLSSDKTNFSNNKTAKCEVENAWNYMVVNLSSAAAYDDTIGLRNLRFDLFNSFETGLTLDLGFVSLFDSEKDAFDFYKGYMEYYCNVMTNPAVAPTCTQTGLTEGKYCSVCEAVLAEQTVVDVIAHNYVQSVCNVCGHVKADALGDVNYDGSVNILDVLALRKYIVSDKYVSVGYNAEYVTPYADVNRDGNVNTADLTLIIQYIVGKDPMTGVSSNPFS